MRTDRRPLPSLPSHVVVMLSASTAAYAVLLAGIAGIQSADDATLAAARAPVAAGLEEITAGYDRLAATLERARGAYGDVTTTYEAVGGRLGRLEATLGDFAASVAELDGQARSMPTSFRLPAASTVGRVSVPTTQGSTGASGG